MKKISLLLMYVFATLGVALNAQNITVKGTVTDRATGEPITGAAVVVQGNASAYSLTDANGAFSITVARDGFLVVSNLGYKTTQVPVNGSTSLSITLEEDAEYLDEVVVTAQGLTRKQKAIGYSAQVLNEETLTMTHSSDMGNSLAGKVAGAQFWGAGGATFNEGTIVLRGATSYADVQGNSPIYVIDGVIASSYAVNMDDVASINILKGPSATALYGSRGANGAVIITTKKAEEGQSHV
ncbi:MAG: carboxypeptidase-like regulatory domain-containing protein, partial [Bacteroidales bacterium]|nr:carboxypeptidase-like regulatory domain-containing protein [Bacteroidales bacterium]